MSAQEPQRISIFLSDLLPLRRAALSRLLEEGTCHAPARLRPVELPAEGSAPEKARLAILNVGAASLRAPEHLARLRELRTRLPGAGVVVLAEGEAPADVVAALRAGARGYVTLCMEPSVLFSALEFVAAGGCFFPPAALLAAQEQEQQPGQHAEETDTASCGLHRARAAREGILTGRQAAVLRALQQGHSNKQIGRELGMNEATVKVHVGQIMRKLGVTNRTQAVLCSLDLGPARARAQVGAETDAQANDAFVADAVAS